MPRSVDPSETHFGEEELDELENEELLGEEDQEEEEDDQDDDDRRLARGDFHEEEDDEQDIEALAQIAGDGRTNKLYPRIQQLSQENQRLRSIVEQAATGRIQTNAGQDKAEEQVPAFNLKEKLKERAEALLEGDVDKIVELDEQIEAHRTAVATKRATEDSNRNISGQLMAQRMNDEADRAFRKYPFLNDASEDHDPEALQDVVMYRDRYIKEGLEPHVALRKAADKVGKLYGQEAQGGDRGGEDGSERSRARILRKANLAGRLPARMSGVGVNGARNIDQRGEGGRDAFSMSRKAYESMSPKEKARARGDIV